MGSGDSQRGMVDGERKRVLIVRSGSGSLKYKGMSQYILVSGPHESGS